MPRRFQLVSQTATSAGDGLEGRVPITCPELLAIRQGADTKRNHKVAGAVVVLVCLLVWALVAGRADEPVRPPTARELAQQAEIESGLKNAATAAETYAVDNDGSYEFADESDLIALGLQLPDNLAIALLEMEQTRYCIILEHLGLPAGHPWKVASYSSDLGTPKPDDDCP